MKTIELRGGPCDGKRMVVPFYSNQVSLTDRKGDSDFVYCPSDERTPGGLEIWKLAWSTGLATGGVAAA
jgi:hypothetical protein